MMDVIVSPPFYVNNGKGKNNDLQHEPRYLHKTPVIFENHVIYQMYIIHLYAN